MIVVLPVLLLVCFAIYATLAVVSALVASRPENRARHAGAAAAGAVLAAPPSILPVIAAVWLVERYESSLWYGPSFRLDLLLAATAAATLLLLAGVPFLTVWASRYLGRLVLSDTAAGAADGPEPAPRVRTTQALQ